MEHKRKVLVINETSEEAFEKAVESALDAGFVPCGDPKVSFDKPYPSQIISTATRFVLVMIKRDALQ